MPPLTASLRSLAATAACAAVLVAATGPAGTAATTTGDVLALTVRRPDASVVTVGAPAPVVPADRRVPTRAEPPAEPPLAVTTTPEGWLVAGDGGIDPVDEGGPTVRWTLEVEPATGLDVATVLAEAEAALHDERSWARSHALERVGDPSRASVRVLVATPATVDALCARAGLRTNGRYSCWNGRVAAINLDRWLAGTPEFTDLGVYRAYVVNHEVGHGLGRDHVDCRGGGLLADVMQQQTRTLAGCIANPWPYPDDEV